MDPAIVRKELLEKFGDALSDEKLLEECVNICQIYNISGEDLFFKAEVLRISSTPMHSEINIFNMDTCAAIKARLQREMAADKAARKQKATLANMAIRGRGTSMMIRGRANIGPGAANSALQVKSEPSGSGSVPSSSRVVYKGPKKDEESRKKRAYRYMYQTISERSEALDERIDELAQIIKEHYNLEELGDPAASTEDEVVVVGRITHDSESSSNSVRLTESILTLESSRMMGSGVRVPLRFEPSLKIRGGPKGAGAIGLFPGAIAALKGKNGGGGWFSVSEVLTMPPMKSSWLPAAKSNQIDASCLIIIGAGPYTSESDLDYKPWKTFMHKVISLKPDVLILIGPFLDTSHLRLQTGDVDATPVELFNNVFLNPLVQFLDLSQGSIALLVPSIRDIISTHAVYPQPELPPQLTHDRRIHWLPNPCRFSLNEIIFAATSVDVLFHLRTEEFVKRGDEVDSMSPALAEDSGTDPMTNLCRHLLQQRSFYPLFPVPLSLAHEVNLDVSHADNLRLDTDNSDGAPDVFILPSRLKHFTKPVQSSLAINPSFVTKGIYSSLTIVGGARTLTEQVKVEIKKIDS